MTHLMLAALVALSGCGLGYVTGNGSREISTSATNSVASTPVVITIDGSNDGLCSPEDTDPQHTCPAKAGPDQR